MNNENISITTSVKKFSSNPLYSYSAKKEFIRNTTTKDVKSTLKVQSFWDKILNRKMISPLLGTRLKKQQRVILQKNFTENTGQPEQLGDFNLLGCHIQSRSVIQANEGSFKLTSKFDILKTGLTGSLNKASLSIGLSLDQWNKDNFICAPGAAYDANRFERYRTIYAPFLPADKWRKDIPIITALIPGFDTDKDQSKLDLLLGEITSPMVGIWLKKQKRSIWIQVEGGSQSEHYGFSLEEDLEKKILNIEILNTMVRQNVSHHGASALPSWDTGTKLKQGDQFCMAMTVHSENCNSISEFYSHFSRIIKQQAASPALIKKNLPLSTAWGLIENQFNQKKWCDQYGYYHSGFIPPFMQADAWNAGWTGGLALSYALLNNGNEVSQQRALRNLEFFFKDGGQSEQGIFYASSDGENWGGDNYWVTDGIGDNDWIHVRRCGDYLYFIIKHFELLLAQGQGHAILPDWLEKTKLCADALCRVWKANQHFGQYIDPHTLNIKIGNSDAGNIIPAALVKCAAYFNKPEYFEIAAEAATFYYQDFCQKGFTAGAPLEVLCAPDCESAINLLESLVVLYEYSSDKNWLTQAQSYVNYVRSWFYTYNVKLPENSIYGQLGIQTTGACYANSQNRCGVPNICTLSGDVFWKLYRYSGDESVMQLIQECVHNTHQYISRDDHKITSMAGDTLSAGTIHECIQTGDWAGPTGEIPYQFATSWAEVAHLLSIAELPGIYLDSDKGKVFTLDHLDVELNAINTTAAALTVTNNTQYNCSTLLYIESQRDKQQPPRFHLGHKRIRLEIDAGKTIVFALNQQEEEILI